MKLSIITFLFSLSYILVFADNSEHKKCGPKNDNMICPDYECCNKDGICGFDIDNYCGDNCQRNFGFCLPSDYLSLNCTEHEEYMKRKHGDCHDIPLIHLRCPSLCKDKVYEKIKSVEFHGGTLPTTKFNTIFLYTIIIFIVLILI